MPDINYSLDIYTKNWTNIEASHLIRRCTFAYDRDIINQSIGLGLVESVDLLLVDRALPSPPLNPGVVDLEVPIGQTWVDKLLFQPVLNYRRKSMNSWTIEQLMNPNFSILEKNSVNKESIKIWIDSYLKKTLIQQLNYSLQFNAINRLY